MNLQSGEPYQMGEVTDREKQIGVRQAIPSQNLDWFPVSFEFRSDRSSNTVLSIDRLRPAIAPDPTACGSSPGQATVYTQLVKSFLR